MHRPEVDVTRSNAYLAVGYLFPETEAALMAIQDQVVPTRNYCRFILKQQIESTKCRVCNDAEETVLHLAGGCTPLAPTRYLNRHNNMGKVVHQLLCMKWGITQGYTPLHRYAPQTVAENAAVKIYWDMPIITDRPVEHNRPDVVLWNKREGSATIIDFAVPLDHNMAHTYATKVNNYLDLAREIKIQWDLAGGVTILPLIVSANGLIHVNTVKHIADLNLPDSAILWMQKAVILGTTAIIRQIIFPQ